MNLTTLQIYESEFRLSTVTVGFFIARIVKAFLVDDNYHSPVDKGRSCGVDRKKPPVCYQLILLIFFSFVVCDHQSAILCVSRRRRRLCSKIYIFFWSCKYDVIICKRTNTLVELSDRNEWCDSFIFLLWKICIFFRLTSRVSFWRVNCRMRFWSISGDLIY